MLSTSPMSAKSIVFLLGLLYLQAGTTEAAISTSAGFPQDLFAKPAFQVNYGLLGEEATTLPIKYSDAIKILEQQDFCHGREIRQFRRLGPQTAAHKAFKAAGGGEAGKKAAIEAADKVNRLHHPIADPEYPAFILGRWTHQSEEIVGDDRSHQRRQQQPLTTDATKESTDVATAADRGPPSSINSAGLDLVEEVQFGDWDEDELFAAETRALSSFRDSNTAVETPRDGQESHRHRYLTQRWTNGTMCDMNHQPRTVEVQYHCSNRQPLEDRIVMFKETTICNYVLVIETPRLCADSAFGSEKEETPFQVQCHKVVRDDWAGPTVGDPDRVQTPLEGIDGPRQSVKSGNGVSKDQTGATTSDPQSAEEPTATSHTYGDPSRFGSVHDDYYDEALGGHGALYQQFHDHDHDHDHDHHGHEPDLDDTEIVVEIGLDDDGKLLVNKLSDSAPDAKEPRRRESGKKRNDDSEEPPMEIHLDMDDFMSVLRGEDGGTLERKLAEKISDVLNKQMEQQYGSSTNNDDDGKKKVQTPEDVAKLYQRLMSAVTGTDGEEAKKQGRKGSKQASPPALRMEKVGDSLSERVKRFYDAKKREEEGEKTEAPPIAAHLEL
uniref:Protein OS-9 homolog n=1 Tax=Kalmanozyma brasiliensis (strain GHG001) TaxID=1365824 RepID=V5EE63_KALBG